MEIPSSCFNNAAYDGVDNFSTDAHLLHALVVLKGDCAQTSGQLPDECPDPVGLRESGGSQRAVFGALVAFQEVVFRPGPNPPVIAIGGIVINPNPAPIIMRRRVALFCRINLGSIRVRQHCSSTGGAQGATETQGSASVGNGALPFQLQSFWPINPQVGNAQVNAERRVSNSLRAERMLDKARLGVSVKFCIHIRAFAWPNFHGNSSIFAASNFVGRTAALLYLAP